MMTRFERLGHVKAPMVILFFVCAPEFDEEADSLEFEDVERLAWQSRKIRTFNKGSIGRPEDLEMPLYPDYNDLRPSGNAQRPRSSGQCDPTSV